jgi:hypothetical protein
MKYIPALLFKVLMIGFLLSSSDLRTLAEQVSML